MTRSPRFMQDAVIGMAILVVLLALWRLHSQPKFLGGLGPWAETNIFGPSTLSLISGQRAGKDQPLAPLTAPVASSNQPGLPGTNPPAVRASPAPGLAGPSNSLLSTHPASTALTNTNGPVTVIAVGPSDLVQTPPGIAAAASVPEASAMERRLGEVNAKGGDIQISLSWGNFNDLDLHCFEPGEEEIWFGNPKSRRTGCELDVDQNAHMPYNASPVEIFIGRGAERRRGCIEFSLCIMRRMGARTRPLSLSRTAVQGQTNFFRSTISFTGARERNLICNLRYDPANPNPAQRLRFVR